MEILDEHYYNSPDWFAANGAKYDSYDRSGPKIYVGEYACTRDCGKGNLRAAVGEAAFMTGMERNADIVVMASYAPLFVNVRDRRWNPDMIGFDSAGCYGTPSYYVQKMFSRNRGDVVLPSALTCKRAVAPALTGAIGLATWRTQAEFKDVKVTRGGQTLLAADLAEDARGWRTASGDWKVQDGAYRQTGTAEDLRSTAGDPKWSDYTYTLKARKIGGAEGFLIMFAARDRNNWFWWNIGGWANVRHAIEKCAGGRKSEAGNSVPGRIETGRWYDIKIELEGARIRCYLDGKLIHDASDSAPEALAAVAGRINKTGDIVLKVVNTSGAPQETQVSLDGAKAIASRGTAIVLTSSSPEDENSLAQPTLVAPVERRVSGLGPKFNYTFPPYSVTILRLSAEK
jgi:alpha-L-arabinofuranosidase